MFITSRQQMKNSCLRALGKCSNVMSECVLCLCLSHPVIATLWAVAHDISATSVHALGEIQQGSVCATVVGGGAYWVLSHDAHCGILGINYQQRQMCQSGIESVRKFFIYSLTLHQNLALMCSSPWVQTRRQPSWPVNSCVWLGKSESWSCVGRIFILAWGYPDWLR